MLKIKDFKKRKNGDTKNDLALSTRKDDFEINYYAKKLRLKKNKKIEKGFYNDGLGELLELFDNDNNIEYKQELSDETPETISCDKPLNQEVKRWVSKRVEENKKKKTCENQLIKKKSFDYNNFKNKDNDDFENEDFKDGNLQDADLQDEDLEDEDLEDKEIEDEDFKVKNSKNKEFKHENLEDESLDEEVLEENFENIKSNIKKNELDLNTNKNFKEDIYGRLLDAKGNVIKGNKIIPKFKEDLDDNLNIKVRSLLNKVSLKTLPYIVEEFEKIFQMYSNNLVCKNIFNCMNQLIIENKILSSQTLCTQTVMMIAVIHSRIGEEVSANILNHIINKLNTSLIELKDGIYTNKDLENMLMIVCIFYALDIISEDPIYDILYKLVEIFNSKSIELILFCIKLVGLILRKDNSGLMKELILNVKQKVLSFDKDKINEKKVIFMLDILTSIKNNLTLKIDFSDIPGIVLIDRQNIRSTLKSLFKDINVNCLKGSFNEILKTNRWFIQSSELLEISMKRKIEYQKKESNPDINEKIIKKLQLTTPFRRVIFKTIIGCEDYVDCCQNLIKITKKQHFEVVNVCVYLCLKEKKFNLFYCHVLRYLSRVDRNFKRGILFILKEKIKNLNNCDSIQQNNLERLIIELIRLDSLSLLVLNIIDFKDMTDSYKNFVSNILIEIFKFDLKKLNDILKKLPKKDSFSIAIKMFINVFLPDNCKLKFKKLKNNFLIESIF